MAGSRTFDGGGQNHAATQTLPGSLATDPFVPYSVAGWIKPAVDIQDHGLFSVARRGGSVDYTYILLNTTTLVPVGAQCLNRRSQQTIITPDVTRVWSAGDWMHLGMGFTSSGDMKGFLDGVKDSGGTARTPNLLDTMCIGWLLDSSPPTNSADGDIAWVALWDVELTDAEFLALARGANPMRIRPSELLCVWPLWENVGTDDVRDIWGGFDLETYETAALSNPGADIAPSDSGPPIEIWWPGKGRGFFDSVTPPAATRNRFHAA